MQFCKYKPHLTVANVNELDSMIFTRAVFISATKCNEFIRLQHKCMTKYYISVSSLNLILLCLQCLCPCITRSPVPQVRSYRIRLVSHQAEHRLQVPHGLAQEAARTEFGG